MRRPAAEPPIPTIGNHIYRFVSIYRSGMGHMVAVRVGEEGKYSVLEIHCWYLFNTIIDKISIRPQHRRLGKSHRSDRCADRHRASMRRRHHCLGKQLARRCTDRAATASMRPRHHCLGKQRSPQPAFIVVFRHVLRAVRKRCRTSDRLLPCDSHDIKNSPFF